MPRTTRTKAKRSRKQTKKVGKRTHQKGGVVLPSEYFGGDSGRYHATGSSALKSCAGQFPVSRGVVHADGKWAGPILSPQHAGGKKKTNKSRKTNKHERTKKSKKSKKSKNLKNLKNPKVKNIKIHINHL
jgi:hypothetical protein